ncbi:hypothetical protein [Flavisphingomonas formosensis]|uniref:hypothetical protein n=1 Tax=Flavisphingomonas formosensis TaxID=861534 RepID=UPI0012F8C9D9|nr:hypothetical protein [Sphingomonas formosensis]
MAADITFPCPNCGETSSIPTSVPPIKDADGDPEKGWASADIEVACPKCNRVFEGSITNHDMQVDVFVEGHPVGVMEVSRAYFVSDEDMDFEIPEYPHTILIGTIKEILSLFEYHNEFISEKIIKRMAFSQAISAMEAFLADTLINAVLELRDALPRLLRGDPELKDAKLPLLHIISKERPVDDYIKSYLKEINYHQLARVDKIYQTSLQFSIFPNDETKSRLFAVIPIRHDCVHRNGYDKDGKMITIINDAFVRQVCRDILEMADHIANKIAGKFLGFP